MQSITGFTNTREFTRQSYIRDFIPNYPDQDSYRDRFKDDNPSVYIWIQKNNDSNNLLSLIDRDDIIEFKLQNCYSDLVMTNCGFLVFLKNNIIIAIYDLFERKNSNWKSLTPDFSFFDSYNYITAPLNCRRIYFKGGLLDLDKVKQYSEDNKKYYAINVDGLYGKNDTSFPSPNSANGFIEISDDALSNIVNEKDENNYKLRLTFNSKPQFRVSIFKSDGTPDETTEVKTYENHDEDGTATLPEGKNLIVYGSANSASDRRKNFCRITKKDNSSNIYNIDLTEKGCNITLDDPLCIFYNGDDFTGYIEVM